MVVVVVEGSTSRLTLMQPLKHAKIPIATAWARRDLKSMSFIVRSVTLMFD